MRKVMIIIGAAVVLAAALNVAAVDINPWQARSNNTDGDPAAAISGDQLKGLWGAANGLSQAEREKIYSDDGTKYDAYDTPDTWNWIMVKLRHTAKDHNFTGHWEAYTDAYADYPCKVYVWDPADTEFDLKDTGPDNTIFTTQRSFTIQPNYWVWTEEAGEYLCIILVEGRTVPNKRWLHVDVVDAAY
jgi:hypothetical protein